ncbi:MAG: DUF3343 domain-containing protein [Geobacteraceae bacterium]|nr:DUF3343 domain-containing protein [Geobacteraceae bacterium]
MVREGDLVAIFNSIYRVMKAEKLLKEHRLDMLLIPVPRSLASDCGLAIRYAEADHQSISAVLAGAELLPEQLYRFNDEAFVLVTDTSSSET